MRACRLFTILCLLVSTVFVAALTIRPAQAAGIATNIESASVNTPAEFWAGVMEFFYGPYNRQLKCWNSTVKGENGPVNVCMRPHKLTSVNSGNVQQHHVVMGGYELNEQNGRSDCHACPGVAGFAVFQSGGPTLDLIGKSILAMSMGSWGSVPAEENFELRIFGDGPAYGWVVSYGYTGQGYTYLNDTIYGMVGDRIREFGLVPTGFNDAGNCENGKNFNEQPCSDYVSTLDFVDNPANAIHDIKLSYSGYRLGENKDGFAFIPFDPESMRYQVPEELLAD